MKNTLSSPLFYCKNNVVYPPFKNGLYLEEYFLEKFDTNVKRKYIPVLWTNFQIEPWFNTRKNEMQIELDNWVSQNPSDTGYFTVVQYDDGPLLKLPPDTVIYGACSGHVPIPLIYQDLTFTLENKPSKTFHQKETFCSFVGVTTHNVRHQMINALKANSLFKLVYRNSWSSSVNKNDQNIFVDTTINSKFALAPRGYGRSSFRFFEIFKLKTIPVYIWDDLEWLPFKETIDYSKLCISINIKDIHTLEDTLKGITEDQYTSMLDYYNQIKNYFDVSGMTQLICSQV